MEAETPRPIFIRSTGGLPSLESLYGWKSQYERMLRWKERFREDSSLDMFLTFLRNCYALRDWLIAAKAFDQKALDALIRGDFSLSLCRDICNRSKHLVLDRPANVDANFFINMQWNIVTQTPEMAICADGKSVVLEELPRACIAFWDRILTERGLLQDT